MKDGHPPRLSRPVGAQTRRPGRTGLGALAGGRRGRRSLARAHLFAHGRVAARMNGLDIRRMTLEDVPAVVGVGSRYRSPCRGRAGRSASS
ncbi:MAG: hypothetical protein M0C28_33890 [Candidatus Moduliflexus flocculans]|nr:hypothetical protein [Candidatus Moduliflexus flocculans]